jgi:hypothetical protein
MTLRSGSRRKIKTWPVTPKLTGPGAIAMSLAFRAAIVAGMDATRSASSPGTSAARHRDVRRRESPALALKIGSISTPCSLRMIATLSPAARCKNPGTR